MTDPEVRAHMRRQFRTAYRDLGLPVPADLRDPFKLDHLYGAWEAFLPLVRNAWDQIHTVVSAAAKHSAMAAAIEAERAYQSHIADLDLADEEDR